MTGHARDTKPTLVLGGTGKTGRRVVARLEQRGLPVRVGSRSAAPPFDWDDRATWSAALDGVGSVYITFHPDLAVPGAVDTVSSFVELAARSGVQRLVLLSARGEPEAVLVEEAVRASGAEATILRSAWFMQNFSEDFLLEPVLSGELALPAGTTAEPFVHADDIAEVAVAALTEDAHVGELYELTGPRLLSFRDAAEEIGDATGRAIGYSPVTLEQYTATAADEGVPPEFVELLRYLFGEVLDGRNARVADGIQRALARPPRDFADYARDTAASGAWNASAVAGRR